MDIFGKKYPVFSILAILVLTAAKPDDRQAEPYFSKSLLCGPNSLLFVCRELGVDAELNEICEATGFKNGVGTSLLGIYKAALAKGLDVVPMKTDIDGLCDYGELSIVFVMDKHFSVVTDCTKDSVNVRDYPGEPRTMHIKRFEQSWNGEALVFNMSEKQRMKTAHRETKRASGPKVAFTSFIRDFGVVERNTILRHTFTFKNVGTAPLHVRVRSTCKCTATLLSQEITQPGESGEIKMEYNTKDKNGISNVKIICRTNDPENKIVTLQLLAEVTQDVFPVPEEFYVGNIATGETVRKVIKMYKSTRSDFKITGIDCPEGIAAHILPKEESQYFNYVIPIELVFKGCIKPGKLDKSIVVHANDKAGHRIEIPVVGAVEAPFRIFPPQLVVNNIPANTTITKEITVTRRNGRPFRFKNISVSDSNLTVGVDSEEAAAVHRFEVTVHAPSKAVVYHGSCDVEITGGEDEMASLPVIVQVVGN